MHEVMELLIGILCGAALSLFFSFGPAFFSLIQKSINYGFRKGVAFVIGIAASDVMIVFLMLTVLKNMDMSATLHNVYVATIGAIAIAGFGIYTFRRKALTAHVEGSGQKRFRAEENVRGRQMMLHGFLLNSINPTIWIWWVTIITFLSAEMDLSSTERYTFFAGLLLANMSVDILKCRLSSMMQTWFTAKVLNVFNKVTGTILIGIAIYIFVSMILYQTNDDIRQKRQESEAQGTRIIQTLHDHMNRDSSSTKRADDTLYLE